MDWTSLLLIGSMGLGLVFEFNFDGGVETDVNDEADMMETDEHAASMMSFEEDIDAEIDIWDTPIIDYGPINPEVAVLPWGDPEVDTEVFGDMAA
ncbi:hypothetical protein [Marivivens aquimaris]|uniref:hypothetical protein n=1 Tax=Marivivens aquimaris TaxID=2774876 RepID=UPI001880ACEE|nr:hypothetical protein [Marivivens aquimaris]